MSEYAHGLVARNGVLYGLFVNEYDLEKSITPAGKNIMLTNLIIDDNHYRLYARIANYATHAGNPYNGHRVINTKKLVINKISTCVRSTLVSTRDIVYSEIVIAKFDENNRIINITYDDTIMQDIHRQFSPELKLWVDGFTK